jgi:hypothetical protein
METLTWSLSGDDATFFEIDDSDQSGSAQSIFIDFKSAYQGNLTYSNPQDFNGDNIYSLILSVSDVQSNTTSVVINFEAIDNNSPTVTLTDSDSDNLVSPTEVVTITATFSESMTATPTISLSGIVSNSEMSATNSATIWTYTWTVSDSVSSTTATVSGTDLSGNAYMGGDSLSFNVNDIIPFTLVKQGSFLKIVKNSSGEFIASQLSDTSNFIYKSSTLSDWNLLSTSFDQTLTRGSWYSLHADNSGNLYVSTKDNGIFKSSDDGIQWTYRVGSGMELVPWTSMEHQPILLH